MAETGGKLYSVGGIQSSSVTAANYQYDPSLNSWATKTSLPKALSCPAVVSYGGKIHVFGGTTNTLGTANVTDHYSYNPSTNTWDTLAAMSEAKSQVMAVVSGSKIHIFGGYKNDGTASSVHQVYDPSNNTWSSAAACPAGMRYGGAVAKDGVIYVISSFGGPVYEYDTVLDSWIKLADNITPRYGFGYGLIGSAIYISQGYAGGILSSTEAYTLPKNIYYLKRD
jgi:N-acetylneuraminic acid mutarotase